MTAKENRPVVDEAAPKAFGGAGINPTPAMSSAPAPIRATSEETLIMMVVDGYLAEIADSPEITNNQVRDELLSRISGEFSVENRLRKNADSISPQLVKPKVLDELTVVKILLARRWIAAIDLAGGRADTDLTLLAMYEESGPNEGLYVADDASLSRAASQIRPSLTANAIASLLRRLRAHASVVARNTDANLIAVNNGIYEHKSQTLLPFSPEFVFLSKSPIDFNPAAANVLIHNPEDNTDWDVESWVAELSDDEGVPELLWEIVSAVLRPNVRWDRAVWFYSERGNNGKGTLCKALRNLVGHQSHASIPIADFGEDFLLEPLIHSTAVIVDENDVGVFSDKSGNYKAAITGDVIPLNRKYKTPVAVRFSGMIVQCFNEFPRTRDRSESFLRRQIIIPFKKWFGDSERGYIKQDYLQREEVLEYMLKRALQSNHTKLSEPPVCMDEKRLFRVTNDPVVDFWEEFEDKFVWDLVPFQFAHALYMSWFRKTNPSGSPLSQHSLTSALKAYLADSSKWVCTGAVAVATAQRMTAIETLISRYELKDWLNPGYCGNDPMLRSTIAWAKNYRGVERRQPMATSGNGGSDDDD